MGKLGRPKKSDLSTYQVAWNWSEEFANTKEFYDDVEAHTAESAIAKLRKKIGDEYDIKKNDLVILEVYKI